MGGAIPLYLMRLTILPLQSDARLTITPELHLTIGLQKSDDDL